MNIFCGNIPPEKEIYRTVSKNEMVFGQAHQPKLSSFGENEISISNIQTLSPLLFQNGLSYLEKCDINGKVGKQKYEVPGLSAWDYNSAHSINTNPVDKCKGFFVKNLPLIGDSTDPSESITKNTHYFILEADVSESNMMDVFKGYAPPKISKFNLNVFFCYCLKAGTNLPFNFCIAEDNYQYNGHRTIFINGTHTEEGFIGPINGKKNVFCAKLHGLWKFHCMKIKASAEPPTFCDYFDYYGWKVAMTIHISFSYLSTEELCNQALLIMEALEFQNFSLDIVVQNEQIIRSILDDVAFCDDDVVQSWINKCEESLQYLADINAVNNSLDSCTLKDRQSEIDDLEIVRLESPVAYETAQRLKSCYVEGSVLAILHKDKLGLLQRYCPPDSFTTLKRINNSDARRQIFAARSTLEQRLSAILQFRELILSEAWKSSIDAIDILAGERKKEKNKNDLEQLMNNTLKSLVQMFGNQEFLWNDHNFDVLYSIAKLENRRFYVLSFFKDIIRTIQLVINSEEAVLISLSEVLEIVDELFAKF